MWLRLRRDDLNEKYLEPWMRIEAFRKLVRATGQAVVGTAQPDEGTGILDIAALLQSELPKIVNGDKKPLAADGWG